MNIENLTKEELKTLADMVQDIYSDIIVRYQIRIRPQMQSNPEEYHDLSASELRERGYLACGILVKLIKTVHAEGMCTDKSCVPRAEATYESFFKKERDLDDWWAKRMSEISVSKPEASPQSNSFGSGSQPGQARK